MQVLVTVGEITKRLAEVKPAVVKKSQIPILETVKLEAADTGLTIASSMSSLSLTAAVDAEVVGPGQCCCPFTKLNKIVNKLPKHATLLLSTDQDMLILECAGIIYKLVCLPVEDFPAIPAAKPTVSIDGLAAAVKKLLPFTSNDPLRYMLQSVYLVSNGTVAVTATDGRGLKHIKLGCALDQEFNYIIPTPAAAILATLQGGIGLTLLDSQIVFSTDRIQLAAYPIDIVYPDYQAVIDSIDCSSLILLDRQET